MGPMGELDGHRAVVTGGGGGLGAVISATLAARGMHVVVVDVEEAAARNVAGDLGGTAVAADLSRDDAADALIADVGEELDVLVNCAGGWSPTGRHYPDSPVEAWDAVLTLNLRTPMRLLQACRPALSRSPVGAAVSISSSAGRGDGAYASPEYAVAKAGLIRLATSLTDWSDRFGIRVSCVVPGWIGLERALDEVAAMPASDRPALIPPADVAEQVVRLVADPASAGSVVVMEPGGPA